MDGLGLAPPGPANPLSAIGSGPLALIGAPPLSLLGGAEPLGGAAPLGGAPPREGFRLIPADACLGVPGAPQSATGGTSLFTGLNAPALNGGHLQGYPNTKLREIICREGILRKLRERGAAVGFANAYTPPFFERGKTRHRSVTTVMAESSGLPLRGLGDLRRGEAVYRDFTNAILLEAGYEVEPLTPEGAGARLGRMARGRDLLLYEYFQTDIVGHRGTIEDATGVLKTLNSFLQAALEELDPAEDTFVLSSDHGNVEDMNTSSHTTNMVPILLWGNGLEDWAFPDGPPSILHVSGGIRSLIEGR